MEYSFPTADGTISSIGKPIVQANNFEIKPSIIQIIWSGVRFFGLLKEDLNKHLSSFLEIRMLRRCPHHELPVWRQVQTFYNGITLSIEILAVVADIIMKKLLSEAFNIVNGITTNLYSYGLERTDRRVTGVHSVDAITAFPNQMVALTQKVDNLGAAIWNGAPIGPYGACGQTGHFSQDFQVIPNPINKDANFVSHGGRSNFNPQSNTYNLEWHNHPNFSWSNNQ
ncbi:UNVERIFIED_CONTAM: hypothetical protein Sradi_4913900 [Sesamum radiatum]|uniref:Uncharacterized protein n=1 Tax=Sesamum radiatum TaxID=300843 RepID=A0AAW2MD90_SESRA